MFGETTEEHDKCLEATLHKLKEVDLTLNEENCEFSKPSVEYLGSVVDSEGVRVHPKRVEAILEMETPKDQSSLRTFQGMVNQLSKYRSLIAELSKPLRDLLSSKSHWSWGDAPQQALKQSLASTPTLAHYGANRPTPLSSDASSYRLGAVLIQKWDNDEWGPVAYASRAMSPTEQRYAQIEKEALGITWAGERFADYLIGLRFHIETYHKCYY